MKITIIVQHSYAKTIQQKLYVFLQHIAKGSYLFQACSLTIATGRRAVGNSKVVAWFLHPSCSLDEFFKESLLLHSLKKIVFSFISWLYQILYLFFRESFFYTFIKSIQEDWRNKSIRVPAWILFGFLSFYASLELVGGSGFSRDQMLYIFIALALLWIWSTASFPSWWFTRHSQWIRFVKDLIS